MLLTLSMAKKRNAIFIHSEWFLYSLPYTFAHSIIKHNIQNATTTINVLGTKIYSLSHDDEMMARWISLFWRFKYACHNAITISVYACYFCWTIIYLIFKTDSLHDLRSLLPLLNISIVYINPQHFERFCQLKSYWIF